MDRLAAALGVSYGPSMVFLGAIIFLLLVCVHLSWEVSRVEERTRILARELALLQAKEEEGGRGAAVPVEAPQPAQG